MNSQNTIVLNLSRIPSSVIQSFDSRLRVTSRTVDGAPWALIADPFVGVPDDLDVSKLGKIFSVGSGIETFDLDRIANIGAELIPLTGVFSDIVARYAIAFSESLARKLGRPTQTEIGILGLGSIGQKLADHFQNENAHVRYFSRTQKPNVTLEFCGSIDELTARSKLLFVCCPGGIGTRHLIGQRQLEALGKTGMLINVARGSIVDSEALLAALEAEKLGGAALDVFDGRDETRRKLANRHDVLMTDHISWISKDSMSKAVIALERSMRPHLANLKPT